VESPDSSAFGELLRESRLRRGWTQEKLAEHAGISPRSISDLERGVERSHYPHTIHHLADALGLEGAERDAFESAARSRGSPLGSRSEILAKAASVLTFLIADVRGYTRFTQERGDEAGARLAARFAELARETAAEHDGQVVELRGDEALAVFTSTRQAVRAAITLQARLGEETQIDPSLPLQAGIGVDAGEAIPFEGGYRGGALNLAARLCALAGPGEVLLSEGVVHLARKMEGLAYLDRGQVQIKGLAEPVRVTQAAPADAPSDAPAAGSALVSQDQPLPIGSYLGSLPDGPIVARDEILESLAETVDAVADGSGHLVVVAGDAGVGKTRLAQELTLRVRDRGFLVATGRCYSAESDSPYFPFLEAISAAYAGASPRVRSEVPKRWPALLGLLPEDAVRLPTPVLDDRELRRRLFAAVAGFLAAIAAERPVTLMLDDLQWADDDSVGLWQHLARQTRAHRVLLLGTYRPGETRREGALESALRDLARERLVERLTLHRLPAEGTAAMIAANVGDAETSEEFAAYVHRRTRGNPYFITEILRALGGRYRLLREIGAGGMGRVFEAVDIRSGKHVAAKIMFARAEIELDALLRFQQEGAVLATLKHPNIVEVFGTFMEEHASCIVMELLDGKALGELMQDEEPDLRRIKRIMGQVAAALTCAHARSIVHRDVKPDNIMVLGDDQVKVTDFGIARVLRRDVTASTQASTGLTMGTPLYTAPEQIEGRKVDGRADIYSVGAVLYQIVTGRPPFEGDDPLTIAYKHVNEAPVPPTSISADLPVDWDELILRCLAKDPADRYPSAGALEAAISTLSVEVDGVVSVPPAPEQESTSASRRRLRVLTPPSRHPDEVQPTGVEPAPEHPPAVEAADPRGAATAVPASTGTAGVRTRQTWSAWLGSISLHKRVLVSSAMVLVAVVVAVAIYTSRSAGGNQTSAAPLLGGVDPNWPAAGSAPGTLLKPSGVALDGKGNVYIADTGNNRIDVFSSTGPWRGSLGTAGSGRGQFRHPAGVAVDAGGNIYVSDTGNDRIQKFSPRHSWLASWGRRGVLKGQFRSPQGLAVDITGNVAVADWGNDRIQELSPSGLVLQIWGTGATGQSPSFYQPQAVAFDPQGNIYVADGSTGTRLHEFGPTGAPLGDWGPSGFGASQIADPTGIAVASNGNVVVTQDIGTPVLEYAAYTHKPLAWRPQRANVGAAGVAVRPDGALFITDSHADGVLELDPTGTVKARWGRPPLRPSGFRSPGAVAVDRKGNVYVADTGRGRVVELSHAGHPFAQLGPKLVGAPQSLATDRQGDLYVLDATHDRVRRFSPTGKLLATWGSVGTGAGGFVAPQGIAVDNAGYVYVTDEGTGTIQKFAPQGTFISIWTVAAPNVTNGIGSIGVDRRGDVYVAVSTESTILKLSSVGRTIKQWGGIGTGPGQFTGLMSLAVSAGGDVFVADNGNQRVQEFSADGSLLAAPTRRSLHANLVSPGGIAVDSRLNVFVTDSSANRVYRLNPRRG
jgi:serine/threonine protein kinase/class 3 adenylate cyclase/sugar lactone lactonase YvrE